MSMKQAFAIKEAKAEALFQTGFAYHHGCDGRSRNRRTALALYNKAMRMGSARAALHIGLLFREEPSLMDGEEGGERQMLRYFSTAGEMGCPDGYYHLYEEFAKGSDRVRQNRAVAAKYLRKAMQQGSRQAMTVMGNQAVRNGRTEYGRSLLERALLAGHGDAGYYLAQLHAEMRDDSSEMLRCLHEGGRKGSARCLRRLAHIYATGEHGQPVNRHYALELFRLLAKSDPDRPAPIQDFDRRFPYIQKWTARRV